MRRGPFLTLVAGAAASFAPGAAAAQTFTPAPSSALRSLGDESSVTLEGGARLFGSLVLPPEAKPPVVLIVPGSGPIDRNGNTLVAGLKTDVYAELAVALRGRGVASLRYDKRGVGESASTVASEIQVRFDDYVADAVAWLEHLKGDPRFSSISLAGHSEGSLIGMLAAASLPVAAFVSLEGAGRPLGQILREQLAPDLRRTPSLLAASERILTALERGETINAVPQELLPVFRPSVQPYLISAFRYDPSKEIAKAGRRAAIVQGTADIQVPVSDAKLLAAARPDAKLVIIDRMTHVLKLTNDPSPDAEIATVYADASIPIAGAVTDAVVAAVRG